MSAANKIYPPGKVPFGGEGAVLTNGCFDILHFGHVTYLEKAALFGSRLIVAINSDAAVRRLKGDGRPINSLMQRMRVIAGLACVHTVCAFEEDDVSALIENIAPHCWIKGGDYTMETLNKDEVAAAKEVGAAIVILEKFGDYSTTGIIERLKG